MVNASELRIGNIIIEDIEIDTQCGRLNPMKPFIIDEDYMEILMGARNYHDYTGVAITPEILQRCGCLIIDESEGIIGETEVSPKKLMQLNIKGGHRLDIDFEGKIVNINYAIRVRNFKFLHQLQNLVFVLSGEELLIQELV